MKVRINRIKIILQETFERIKNCSHLNNFIARTCYMVRDMLTLAPSNVHAS